MYSIMFKSHPAGLATDGISHLATSGRDPHKRSRRVGGHVRGADSEGGHGAESDARQAAHVGRYRGKRRAVVRMRAGDDAATACVCTLQVMPLMKKNAVLAYSHGFNIVEEGMKIRKDLTVPIEPSILYHWDRPVHIRAGTRARSAAPLGTAICPQHGTCRTPRSRWHPPSELPLAPTV